MLNARGWHHAVEIPVSALDLGARESGVGDTDRAAVESGQQTRVVVSECSVFDCAFRVWWLGGPGAPGVESSQWRMGDRREGRGSFVYI